MGVGLGVGVGASLRESASAFELAPTLGAAASAGLRAGDPAGFSARATSTGGDGDPGELDSSLALKVGADSIGNAAVGVEGWRDTREAFVIGRFTASTGRTATRAGADVGSADGDGLGTDAGSESTIAFGPGVGGAGRTANEAGRCVEAEPGAGAAA